MRYKDLLSSNDILNLIKNEFGLEAKQSGKNIFFLCPFHDDTRPSFSFEPNLKIFACWSCNFKARDSFDVWAEHRQISKKEALKEIGQKGYYDWKQVISEEEEKVDESNPLDLVTEIYQHNLFTIPGQIALNYLKKRKVSLEMVNLFSLGCSINHQQLAKLLAKNEKIDSLLASGLIRTKEDKNYDFFSQQTLIIPLFDNEGKIVAFAGRKIKPVNNESKYLYLPSYKDYQKSHLLYNYQQVKGRKINECYLVEGFFDVISLTMSGIENCLGLLGTGLSEEQIKLLAKLKKRIILFLDGDRAGKEATINVAKKLLLKEIDCEIISANYQSDPDEIFRQEGKEKLKEIISQKENPYKYIVNYYYSQLEIADNPQRITVFIEKLARIFENFKINVKDFVIERISELTKWRKIEIETKFIKQNFPTLSPQIIIKNDCQKRIKKTEAKLINLLTRSRANWVYFFTRRIPLLSASYQKICNYFEFSWNKTLEINSKEKNQIKFNNHENKLIDEFIQKITWIKKFYSIIINEQRTN